MKCPSTWAKRKNDHQTLQEALHIHAYKIQGRNLVKDFYLCSIKYGPTVGNSRAVLCQGDKQHTIMPCVAHFGWRSYVLMIAFLYCLYKYHIEMLFKQSADKILLLIKKNCFLCDFSMGPFIIGQWCQDVTNQRQQGQYWVTQTTEWGDWSVLQRLLSE